MYVEAQWNLVHVSGRARIIVDSCCWLYVKTYIVAIYNMILI